MKSKAEQPKPLPGEFVKCPVRLLEADLAALAVKLWLIIAAHCIKTEEGFPGITRLTKLLGVSRTWTLALISELETKGFLAVKRRKGLVNVYVPMIPASTSQVELTSQPQLTGQVELTNQSSGVDGGSQVELTRIIRTESEEINQKSQPSAVTCPSLESKAKKSKRFQSNSVPTQTKEDVETAIAALDLDKFTSKYPTVDIDQEHQAFADYYLGKNDPKTGKPNWMKWNDWNRAFHNWCKRAPEFQADRKALPPCTPGTPQPQDLSNYRLEDDDHVEACPEI